MPPGKFFYSLLTRRNAIIPVFLLPPEILAQVFHFLVLEEPPCFGKQDLGWIRATHVCRHWRQVALRDLSWWARISGIPTNTKWVSRDVGSGEEFAIGHRHRPCREAKSGKSLLVPLTSVPHPRTPPPWPVYGGH
ncbi:hypothetical protein F5888DRAFT_1693163 [Russula emetica]|nr:hypothetical protein F5888DRAFT_1693163 [Russula emetica]